MELLVFCFISYYNSMISEEDWIDLKTRLEKSKFRSRFHLKDADKEYIEKKGLSTIEDHAYDFILKRLAPAVIANDGKQTPMKGHPVFIAQHETALCCRGCMEKWHHIEKGRALTKTEIDYAISVIMHYIKDEIS